LEKELLELRQSYDSLRIEYETEKSSAAAAPQVDETEMANLRSELETSRHQLQEFETQMMILGTEKNQQAHQFKELTLAHDALQAQLQELLRRQQQAQTEATAATATVHQKTEEFELERQAHQQEVVKLREKLSALEIQNERKDGSILRMRKLFSQEIEFHDESVFSSSAGTAGDDSPPRSPLRSGSKDDCDRIIDSMEKKVESLPLTF
jgi:chromosome segregation ATPase